MLLSQELVKISLFRLLVELLVMVTYYKFDLRKGSFLFFFLHDMIGDKK